MYDFIIFAIKSPLMTGILPVKYTEYEDKHILKNPLIIHYQTD